VNRQQLGDILNSPSRKFKGPKGPEFASVCIQKYWRRFKAFTAYSQLKFLMAKATVIQRKFRLYQLMKSTKQKIKELNNESLVSKTLRNNFSMFGEK
jgi:hypothetical protein